MYDYLEMNKKVYNDLAEEYFERLEKYDNYYKYVGVKICDFIMDEYLKNKKETNANIKVLELGCGPGAILQTLNKYKNLSIYAIDFSENMILYSTKSNESIQIKNANILEVEDIDILFKNDLTQKIDIIILAAFIHLFPIKDAKKIMENIYKWLSPEGIIYIDTTNEENFKDGSICIKKSQKKENLMYFRTSWTKKIFNNFIYECGFKILKQVEHISNDNKIWMRTILKK